MAELDGLIELGCFELIDKEEAKGQRIHNHSFVDKLKPSGEKKSRFIVAAHSDHDHGYFVAAPTVKRISIRLLLSVCASYRFSIGTRDVKKAFVMSRTKLRRPVFLRPPQISAEHWPCRSMTLCSAGMKSSYLLKRKSQPLFPTLEKPSSLPNQRGLTVLVFVVLMEKSPSTRATTWRNL